MVKSDKVVGLEELKILARLLLRQDPRYRPLLPFHR
jgi:hypothetical protein